MIGRTVSHFRITAKLGEGGMGEVYRAEDTKLKRDVALKILPPELAASPERLERFQREAEILAALDHPNIVTVFTVEHEEGLRFLTMQLVEGRQLSELIPSGGMTLERIFEIGMPLADALAAAHEKGVIHRDLKPANIKLSADGRVRVLDFGIAKLRPDLDPAVAPELTTEPLTREGLVLGTLPYMSPEQLEGRKLDARTDIFSLGVILYEMAIGERPFKGESSLSVVTSILRDTPREIDTLRPDLPHHLARIIRRCIEKDPQRRFQSARDVRDELAALKEEQRGTPKSTSAGAPAGPAIARRTAGRSRPVLWLGGAGVVVAALVAVFAFSVGEVRDRFLGRTVAPEIDSLAVLPLRNLTGDAAQEYFVDGMQDALITELSKIGALRVISRSSALRYRQHDKPLSQVARELRVDALVEGSVLRDKQQVRITVQLVHGPSDRQLWAQSFDRELRGILALQSEVAQAIAGEIRIKVTPDERLRLAESRPVHPEAHEAYLKGRYLWERRTPEDLRQALQHFDRAIEIDPSYPLGHAGLADTYYILGNNMMVAPDESYPRARAAAQKALELDPGLAEAHTTLAAVLMAYDWEWLASERAFDRAVELKPGYATAHHWRSFLLSALGRHSEAVAAIKRARELDPLSPRISANVGLMLYTARRYDESILELQEVLKLWPDDAATHIYLGQSLVEVGRHAQAIVEIERGRELLAGVPAASLRLACARASAGEQQRAREIVEAVVSERTVRHVSATVLAEAYTALGETNQALLWLERAYAEREAELIELAVNPALDPLRSERRFEEILRRMKFPEQTGT